MLVSQAEPSDLFGRGQHEDNFCEIILILDQWFRRFHLKIFLIYSSANPFFWHSKTICAILGEGNMKKISVKLS